MPRIMLVDRDIRKQTDEDIFRKVFPMSSGIGLRFASTLMKAETMLDTHTFQDQDAVVVVEGVSADIGQTATKDQIDVLLKQAALRKSMALACTMPTLLNTLESVAKILATR